MQDHAFSKGICSKVNITTLFEFKLTQFETSVQHLNHYATRNYIYIYIHIYIYICVNERQPLDLATHFNGEEGFLFQSILYSVHLVVGLLYLCTSLFALSKKVKVFFLCVYGGGLWCWTLEDFRMFEVSEYHNSPLTLFEWGIQLGH